MTTLEIIQSIILGLLIIGGGGFWLRKYLKQYYYDTKRENEELVDRVAALKKECAEINYINDSRRDDMIKVLPFVDTVYLHKQPSVEIKTAFSSLVYEYEKEKGLKYAEVEKKKVVVPMRPPKSN